MFSVCCCGCVFLCACGVCVGAVVAGGSVCFDLVIDVLIVFGGGGVYCVVVVILLIVVIVVVSVFILVIIVVVSLIIDC